MIALRKSLSLGATYSLVSPRNYSTEASCAFLNRGHNACLGILGQSFRTFDSGAILDKLPPTNSGWCLPLILILTCLIKSSSAHTWVCTLNGAMPFSHQFRATGYGTKKEVYYFTNHNLWVLWIPEGHYEVSIPQGFTALLIVIVTIGRFWRHRGFIWHLRCIPVRCDIWQGCRMENLNISIICLILSMSSTLILELILARAFIYPILMKECWEGYCMVQYHNTEHCTTTVAREHQCVMQNHFHSDCKLL